MKDIIKEKAMQVPEVKDFLLATGDRKIAEAVQSDQLWSCGLSKEAAKHTDPDKWPGQNILGELWMEVRDELRIQEGDGYTRATVRGQKRNPSGEPINRASSRARVDDASGERDK